MNRKFFQLDHLLEKGIISDLSGGLPPVCNTPSFLSKQVPDLAHLYFNALLTPVPKVNNNSHDQIPTQNGHNIHKWLISLFTWFCVGSSHPLTSIYVAYLCLNPESIRVELALYSNIALQRRWKGTLFGENVWLITPASLVIYIRVSLQNKTRTQSRSCLHAPRLYAATPWPSGRCRETSHS